MLVVEDNYPEGRRAEQQINDLNDGRIRYLRNERNLGTAGNTHRCIQLAERDYFVVMGADDLLMPSYGKVIGSLVDQYPQAALVHPGVEVIDENDLSHRPIADRVKGLLHPRQSVAELRGEAAVASLLRGNWLYTPAVVYRRDSVVDLPMRPGLDAVHDLALVVDILMRGGSLVVSQEPAFQYRRHRDSHSSSHARNGQRFLQEKAYFEDIERELSQCSWHGAARAARHRLLSRLNALIQVPGALRSGNRAVAGSLLDHALRR
jgi:hypothetical protein